MKRLCYLTIGCLLLGFAACSDDDKSTGTSTAVSGAENGHAWVDLGLPSGTKWATCNVGAENPQDYGGYYAWGETSTKSVYDWITYDFLEAKTTLDLENDAAHVNWGGKWVMPTRIQQEELFNECCWVWTANYNGTNVAGYIVYKAKSSDDKGRKVYEGESSSYSLSDTHIFLPAAGVRFDDNLVKAGTYGVFWSSSLNLDDTNSAWFIDYTSNYVHKDYDERCSGQSVRAVIP